MNDESEKRISESCSYASFIVPTSSFLSLASGALTVASLSSVAEK
jgi:hypothetical protein